MRRFAHAAIALLAVSGASLAQQPMTYPGRSQSAGQQSVDTAACYAMANQTTHVNMARESQRPPPPGKAAAMQPRPVLAPAPVNPPLPASVASAASGASGAAAASAAVPGSSVATAAASAPAAASGATPPLADASAALAASGASAPMPGSGAQYAETKLPPPPPPEPPMTRYWDAYGKCMQQRGYYIR
jgi:hypothetical protein